MSKYQILITSSVETSPMSGGGCSTHSVIAKFDNREQADTAVEAIKNHDSSKVSIGCIPLY